MEHLSRLDTILVHQKVDILEVFIGFERNNKYTILNTSGQTIMYAVEDSNICIRNCCGAWRPFHIKILDASKTEVIHLHRPLACNLCFFPCCLQSIQVYTPPGKFVGSVKQEWSLLLPLFTLRNADDQIMFKLKGPLCTYNRCFNATFKMMPKDSSEVVGKVAKQWPNLMSDMFTNARHFGVSFPQTLDVNVKAIMLGACFLIYKYDDSRMQCSMRLVEIRLCPHTKNPERTTDMLELSSSLRIFVINGLPP